MITLPPGTIAELDERSRAVFRAIVETYVETGEPMGSRTLSRLLPHQLSPATIRNVMADLEDVGLLYAPHTSAGRLPTEAGLRLFVDGLLERGNLSEEDRRAIEARCAGNNVSLSQALEEASSLLSGLSRCAGLVVAPTIDRPLKHIEFVNIGDGRALVVLVTEDGMVENRIIQVPLGTPPSALVQAANYLNARLAGRTLVDARATVQTELDEHRAALDVITTRLVEAGLATRSGENGSGTLIVRGQAHLLQDVAALEDLERIRGLFEALEKRELIVRLLELSNAGEGVQIFIGSQNALFNYSGCSMVVAPYSGSSGKIVGAIGVIGPTRINYARIIPLVDYTAKAVGRLIG
jgi:heat-inducible transcriptional repressor